MTDLELIKKNEGLHKQLQDLVLSQKPILTFDEAATYTGFSKSYLYKLTYRQQIPHYKPTGKLIFFNRAELDQWIMTSQAEREKIEAAASTYVTLNLKGGGK